MTAKDLKKELTVLNLAIDECQEALAIFVQSHTETAITEPPECYVKLQIFVARRSYLKKQLRALLRGVKKP